MNEMEYVKIPYVSKPLSKIVFGTAIPTMLYGENAFEILDSMYALGVTTFDTARAYGDSEVSLGEWINARKLHDKVVVLSKCAHPSETRKRVTPEDILSDLETSFKKLKMEYIDLYLLHRDDLDVSVGPIVEILNQLHSEGKIGAFGGSNWTHERIAEANNYAKQHSLIPFTVSSPNFGLADQVNDPWGGGCITISGHKNINARKWYSENNMPVFAYSSLGRGLFSGIVNSSKPQEADKILDPVAVRGYCYPENFERLRRVEILAKEKGFTVPQIAMAWLLKQPINIFAIVSPGKADYMKDNIKALHIDLTQRELEWLDLIVDTKN